LRLRIPFKPFRKEITEKTALVRELHVYGPLVPVGKFKEDAFQHKGLGKRLLEEAERIAKEEFNMNKIVVISGAGVKKYYYNLGYKPDGPYVSKVL
jgi:elongator complex protein 3